MRQAKDVVTVRPVTKYFATQKEPRHTHAPHISTTRQREQRARVLGPAWAASSASTATHAPERKETPGRVRQHDCGQGGDVLGLLQAPEATEVCEGSMSRLRTRWGQES